MSPESAFRLDLRQVVELHHKLSCISSLPLQISGPLSLRNCVSLFLLINLSLFIHHISSDSLENPGLLSADLLSLYYINLYWLKLPITHVSEKFRPLKVL